MCAAMANHLPDIDLSHCTGEARLATAAPLVAAPQPSDPWINYMLTPHPPNVLQPIGHPPRAEGDLADVLPEDDGRSEYVLLESGHVFEGFEVCSPSSNDVASDLGASPVDLDVPTPPTR